MTRLLGVVLAGGASRRFASDKALAEAWGRPLIAHAIDAIAAVADAVVICGHAYPGAVRIADRPLPGLGPLGGLNAGLHHAAAHGYERVLSIACDTPFLRREDLDRLAAQAGPCLVAGHPVIGMWPASLAADLDRFLAGSDDRSMRAWGQRCGAQRLAIEGIANINYREDLDAILAGGERRPD